MSTSTTAIRHHLFVWLALVALTALSYGLSLVHLGSLDVGLSLLIATIKASLVLLFFMHLAGERLSIVLVPIVATALVVLLLGLVALDVGTRHTFPRAVMPLDEPADPREAPPAP